MSSTPGRGAVGVIFSLAFLALSFFALREIRLQHVSQKVGELMEVAVNSKFIKEYGNLELRKEYTGITGVDMGLQYLVVAFLPGALGLDQGIKLQQAHFLITFFPIIAIMSVEAGRARNKWSLLYFTSFWGLLYQTIGGAVIIPLYHLAYMVTTSSKDYWTPATRAVSLPYAKALLPALLVGYLAPTVAIYAPHTNVYTVQGYAALWQPVPFYVNILLVIFSTLLSFGKSSTKAGPEGTTEDVRHLQRVYLVSFAVAAVSHWFTIATLFLASDPNLTFFHALWPRKDFLLATSAVSSMHAGLLYIFQVDFWIIFGSSLVWAYLAILDTNRAARAYVAPLKAMTVMGINTVLFGPGATVAAIWFSRESTLAGLQKSKAN